MGSSFVPLRFLSVLAWLALGASAAVAAAPVLEGLPVNGGAAHVPPIVPVGKALILPLTAHDADGDPVKLTVTSSSPKVMVRVKTGNPLLKFRIEHDGDGTEQDPAFSGDLVFQLFRDLTPETAAYIAGFAQAGFYDGVVFHRLADLYDDKKPETPPAPAKSFIFQGGDPLGTGGGGPGFRFENEFVAPLIFAGRGQLAMANAGYDGPTPENPGANYGGTNGSQFFITDGVLGYNLDGTRVDGRPRFLDFGHTIFGQLIHGWDLLEKLRATPRDIDEDRPLTPVRIVSAAVVPSYNDGTRTYTDAVLVVTAKAPGKATISVRADDRKKGVTVKRFKVTAERDPVNSPPFLSKLGNHTVALGTRIDLPFDVYDLEYDHVRLDYALLDNGTPPNLKGESQLFGERLIAAAGYVTGPLKLALGVKQYDMLGSNRDYDDFSGSTIAVGAPPVVATGHTLQGAPGALLSQVAVARFSTPNSANIVASINWGDGTPSTQGVISPAGTAFQVAGSHTYARTGVYPVTVTLTSPTSAGGLLKEAKGTAVISSGPIRAVGNSLSARGRTVNGFIATFTDDGSVNDKNYEAVIDWGDGVVTRGTPVQTGPETIEVLGKHAYRDSQVYSVSVRISRAGAPETEVVAWSTVKPEFKSKPYLPPFAQSHLVAALATLLVDSANPAAGEKQVRTTVALPSGGQRTYLTLGAEILNSGNKKSAKGKLQFFLSRDVFLNTKQVKNSDGSVTPADLPLRIGKAFRVAIPALKPGQAVRLYFDKTAKADFRIVLPNGINGDGYYLLGTLIYPDSVGKHMPIDREVVIGPFSSASTATMARAIVPEEGTAELELDPDPAPVIEAPEE